MHPEMFALNVDLCDKCDPSQTKGLVWYNFVHGIENKSVSGREIAEQHNLRRVGNVWNVNRELLWGVCMCV